MILRNPHLSKDHLRAAWLARYGSGWVDVMEVSEDNLFFAIASDLVRLDCMNVDVAREQYQIKLRHNE